MNLTQTVSKIKGKEVTTAYARKFADEQFGMLVRYLKDEEEKDKFIITWQIDDVKSVDEDLTDEQCVEILERFEHHHEGSMEAMWWDLEYHVGEFKEAQND